ncbi:MAG: DUF3467 domain-containing protein [Nitrospiria bacterium]
MSNQQPVQVQIEIDDATAQGIYSNLTLMAHNETEFILDFVFIQPQAPKAKVRARILSNPIQTKRMLIALTENIRRYEKQFGTIKMVAETEKEPSQYQGHYL